MPLTTKQPAYEFRYTNNGKVYGSESDYGSEYGMDANGGGGYDEHGQQQVHHNGGGGRHRGGSPSEAGTYHSRYDGGGSTLNRYKYRVTHPYGKNLPLT